MDLENSEIKLPLVDEVWVDKAEGIQSVISFVFIRYVKDTVIGYGEYLYDSSDGSERFGKYIVSNIQWFLNNFKFDQKLTNDFIIKGIIE